MKPTCNEVVYWRKNVFLISYGKIGKDFIDELTLLINDWNYETERQHVALNEGGGGRGGGATASEGQVYMCVPRLLVESLISSPVYRLNFPRSG